MSTGYYRDRAGLEPRTSERSEIVSGANMASMTRRTMTSSSTAAAYSSSSLSRSEVTSGQHQLTSGQHQLTSSSHVTQSRYSASSNGGHAGGHAGGHYAVSSHVNNGNLVVDNGAGVIQQTHGHYEENLSKFKGDIWLFVYFTFYSVDFYGQALFYNFKAYL